MDADAMIRRVLSALDTDAAMFLAGMGLVAMMLLGVR